MLGILSLDISLLTLLIGVLFIIIGYILIELVLVPWKLVNFYKNKGYITQFKPIVSTFSLEDTCVTLRGQYYARMIDMCKLKERPLGLVRNVGRTCMIVLYDAEMIREMFINKDAFIKHPFQNTIMRHLSPFGLILLQGDWWKKHRRMISKGFEYERIDSVMPIIIESARQRLSLLGKENKIDNIMNFFKQSAGQIIGEVFFNYDLNQKKIDGIPLTIYLSDTIAILARLSYSPVFCATNFFVIKLGLFEEHRMAMNRVKLLRQAVREIVRQCMAKVNNNQDQGRFSMWRVFTEGTQSTDVFNEEEMIDEFITFFSDGVYTTGLFMTMFTYYMIQNPEWMGKLRKQLKQNILDKKVITQRQIQSLPVLQGCIKETLRLAPPVVTGIERIATKDFQFSNGEIIKKDTMVMACHIVNHIDQKYHDNPLQFDPLRWEGETKTTRMYKEYPGSYIPFSIGERNCPGQKFAQTQTSVLFAQLFNQFDISLLDPQYKLQFTQRFLREPLNPLGCVLKSRQ